MALLIDYVIPDEDGGRLFKDAYWEVSEFIGSDKTECTVAVNVRKSKESEFVIGRVYFNMQLDIEGANYRTQAYSLLKQKITEYKEV